MLDHNNSEYSFLILAARLTVLCLARLNQRSMSGRNTNAQSSKGGIKLHNTQWQTIKEQLEVFGRKRAPTETEKFFAPFEIAGAANHHHNGRFALGAAGIAFPWEGGLAHFKKEHSKKDPVARPNGFKACIANCNWIRMHQNAGSGLIGSSSPTPSGTNHVSGLRQHRTCLITAGSNATTRTSESV